MEASEFFIKLIIIFISAKFFAEFFAYLRLPSVLGEVIAGIIIGPSFLGLIEPDATLILLAEIGILLLLFEVGLETDVGQVMKVGVQATLVAITGVAAPMIAGFWISYSVFDFSLSQSLFIGGTLVATSIGITVRVLSDLKRQDTDVAKVVLGAAVLDDVIGVVILAILYDFSVKGSIEVWATARVLFFVSLFMTLAPVIAKILVPIAAWLASISRTKGMIPTLIIVLILFLSVISHNIGAPEMLGSFVAGIALARRFFLPFGSAVEQYSKEFGEKIEDGMKPIIELFVPLFFVMIGASIDFRVIDFSSSHFWNIALLLTFVAIAGKLVSGLWLKGSRMEKLSAGIAMVPRGEVGLIFAEVGRKNNIFDDTIYAVIVFVVAFTTLIAPLALRYVMRDQEER